ncbi:MAG TPA: hypothetical protein VIE66_20965 [Methylocella sp.]
MGETITHVKKVYLSNSAGARLLAFGALIFALFIASAYILDIAGQHQRTLSIVVRPCGNDTSGA